MSTVEIFKALGDPTRLKIVRMVAEAGELCVCKIVEQLDMGQPAISHHLAKLRYAGLLRAKKQGQWVYYSLNIDLLEEEAHSFLRSVIDSARKTEPAVVDACAGACDPAP